MEYPRFFRPGGELSNPIAWDVEALRTGNWSQDCEIGHDLAKEALAFVQQTNGDGALVLVCALREIGEGGIETGFLHELVNYGAHGFCVAPFSNSPFLRSAA